MKRAQTPGLSGLPWHDICLRVVQGGDIRTVARQWGVTEEQIREHLIAPINPSLPGYRTLRTHTEVQLLAREIKDDLATYLQKCVKELMESRESALEKLSEFATLTACASKLFGWQTAISKYQFNPPDANSVVNLNLISKSPQQLAELAMSRGLLPSVSEPIADPRENGTDIEARREEG